MDEYPIDLLVEKGPTLPLVDGGVIDNQGMDGVMIAAHPPFDKVKSMATVLRIEVASRFWNAFEGKPGDLKVNPDDCCQLVEFPESLGLYIISDDPCPSEDIYEPKPMSLATLTGADRSGFYLGVHLPRKLGGWLTLGRMNAVAWILTLMSAITAAQIIGYSIFVGPPYGGQSWGFNAFFLHAVPLTLAGILFGSLLLLQVHLRMLFRRASPLAPHLWKRLKHLSINDLIYMTYARVSSTWALTSTIFLNRIRRLMYRVIYWTVTTPGVNQVGDDAERKKVFAAYSRLAPCDIQRLAQPPDAHSIDLTDWPKPTDEMRQVAHAASHMGTTLWLTKKQIDDLVVCGQLTTCFSLLQNLYCRRGESQGVDDPYKRTRNHWDTLQKDCRAFLPDASDKKDSSTENLNVRKAKA